MSTEFAPTCPKCNGPMVLRTRRSDQGKFWGCENFPVCDGIVRYVKNPVAQRTYSFSPFQEAIFDFVANGKGNAFVRAVAGSGKTTTLVEALRFTPRNAKVSFMAFSKSIAGVLADRAPSWVGVKTLHSQGLGNIRMVFDRFRVDGKKNNQILLDLIQHPDTSAADAQVMEDNFGTIIKIVSLMKATMSDGSYEDLRAISERLNAILNGDEEVIFEAARRLFEISIRTFNVIDFDDMIYFSAAGIVPCEKLDFMMIDESQDLNRAQINMTVRSMAVGGRVICVGDPNQSVFAFRGADVEATKILINTLEAKIFPLSITYRCPASHVRLAQELVPEIQAAPNAKEGTVKTINRAEFLKVVKVNDMVICRTNAPLVSPVFALIRQGVKASIRGRDIGKDLNVVVGRVTKKSRATNLNDFLVALDNYIQREVIKLTAANKGMQAETLLDQAETIYAIADGCTSIQEVSARIDSVFSDDVEGIVFSSIHRAKGLEAKSVYILRPDLLPHPLAKSPQELEQEKNLKYVALTRSMDSLVFVEGK